MKRQAVILIHGIGEQRPIETLRGFVEAIIRQMRKKKLDPKEQIYFWEQPEPASGNYETRKMTIFERNANSYLDCYELYWAHHIRETKWEQIKDWFFGIMWRRDVPERLLCVWRLAWGLLGLLLILFLTPLFVLVITGLNCCSLLIASGIGVGIIFLLAVIKVPYYLLDYLGDAGRYLDPVPGNIAGRQAVREEGMKLLKNLHESGKYERIVVVGHSLGSVIGYDLVRLLWNEYCKTFDEQKFKYGWIHQTLHTDDIKCSEEAGKRLDGTEGSLTAFQNAQETSYGYLKAIGNKWLVTDLVTIGSPLAHAGYLFAQKNGLFRKLKMQREYPKCPPFIQKIVRTNIRPSGKIYVDNFSEPITASLFNHSSPFAVTKWTNIYYESDFIGGPLADKFGKGIRDIKEQATKWFCHTTYWDVKHGRNILPLLCEIFSGGMKSKHDEETVGNDAKESKSV